MCHSSDEEEVSAVVLASPQLGSAPRGRAGGINRRGEAQAKYVEVHSSGQQQPRSLKKLNETPSLRQFLAIFLATLCLLNMHFMLYLLVSSPLREQLALTLLASRAVQHCALYKSQQP